MSDRPPLKISISQINTTPCDCKGNIERIISAWDKAEEDGCHLLITPEQSVTGYPLQDMARHPDLIEVSEHSYNQLIEESKKRQCAAIIGYTEQSDDNIYNSAALIHQGQVVGHIRKQCLPNFDVFDEKRIYTAGEPTEPIEFMGYRLGVMICGDLWETFVAEDLTAKDAEILISINASPYHQNKPQERIDNVIGERIKENGLPIIYVNQVGGDDELVFDGHSIALNKNGDIAYQAPGFIEHQQNLTLNPDCTIEKREENITPFISDHEMNWTALIIGLRDYVLKNNFQTIILGLSGGVDSAAVAVLACDALGAENVYAYKLPSQYSSQSSHDDADELAERNSFSLDSIEIQPVVDVIEGQLLHITEALPKEYASITHENLQSRIRGTSLMALSNHMGALLLSTGNKSELSVGYATIYGDMNGAFNPIKDVYKTDLYELIRYRNQNRPAIAKGREGTVVPNSILTKAPSAELKPDQTDQDTLPPYEELDAVLRCYIEQDMGIETIIKETKLSEAVVADIVQKVDRSEFKRRQSCPGTKISERSFGKGRRVPIVRPDLVTMRSSTK